MICQKIDLTFVAICQIDAREKMDDWLGMRVVCLEKEVLQVYEKAAKSSPV